MKATFQIIRDTVVLAVALAVVGWIFVRVLKRSTDPARLLFKWVLTAGVFVILTWKVGPYALTNPFIGVPLVAACGLVLAVIWRENLTDLAAKPFTSLYDGGDAEIEPRAYYSVADAKRKKGQYLEAVVEIRKQLDNFPNDFEGHIKLAEIQAENLNDLAGAEVTIRRFCAQPGHAPINVAFALNTLADWHLKYGRDRDAARRDLEQVGELLPDSEFALLAAQRIASLEGLERTLEARNRPSVMVPEAVGNIGLMRSSAHLRPIETDPGSVASQYVEHLNLHPQDAEVREKLAIIYADQFGQLDMAVDQLDQLIEQPNQPARRVVHWLNLLADLQLRHGAELDTVRQTLSRIIERYPSHAAANVARNRLDLLKLEIKARAKAPAVRMGAYEQNIGLKPGASRLR